MAYREKYVLGLQHADKYTLDMWNGMRAADRDHVWDLVNRMSEKRIDFERTVITGPDIDHSIYRNENETVHEHSNQPRWHEALAGKTKDIIMGPYSRSRTYKLLHPFYWEEENGYKSFDGLPPWSGSTLYMCIVSAITEKVHHREFPDDNIISECERVRDTATVNAPFDYAHEIDKLMIACIAKAKMSAYDVATEIAEGRETLHFFHGIYKRAKQVLIQLYYAWRAIRNPSKVLPAYRRYLKRQARRVKGNVKWKGSYGVAIDQVNSVAHYWLMYRYAVMPLMYSVHDFCKARGLKGTVFQKFHTTGHLKDVKSYDYYNNRIETVRTLRVRCTIRQRIDGDSITNKYAFWVPTAIWEIVPFSFVLDWFVNIGQLIQAFRPDRSDDYMACISTRTETSVICTRYIKGELRIDPGYNKPSVMDDSLIPEIQWGYPSYHKVEDAEGIIIRTGNIFDERWLTDISAARYATFATSELWNTLKHEIDALALLYVTLGKSVLSSVNDKHMEPERVLQKINNRIQWKQFRGKVAFGAKR